MYQLTKRQESILYYILESKEIISTKKLASKYNLSERSIHYDLDYINSWAKEKGCRLKKNKPNGIFLEGAETSKAQIKDELFRQDVKAQYLPGMNRAEYIFIKLLLSERVIASEEFSNDLMVSRPTVLNSIREAEKKANKQQLQLLSKKGSGYWLEGKEGVFRTRTAQTIIKILMQNRIHSYEGLRGCLEKGQDEKQTELSIVLEYMKGLNIVPIYDVLYQTRKKYGIRITDSDFFELLINIIVMVKRLLHEHTVEREMIAMIERKEEEQRYELARRICEQLEEDYDIICGKSEVAGLVLRLIGSNVEFSEKGHSHHKKELGITIDTMLQVLVDYKMIHINASDMEDLKEDLYEYLDLQLSKKKLQIKTPNPLLVQTKAGYPHIFEEAARMAEIFSRREGVELTEDEIAAITIYIAAYAENPESETKKTILIVCNEGKGLSKVLYNRIKNNIPGLYIKGIVSLYEMEQSKDILTGVDFVISTADMHNLPVPVFSVSPIISVFDIRYISNYVTGHTSEGLIDAVQQQEHQLEDAIMGVLGKYLGMPQLRQISKEMDYILSASAGFVTAENIQLIQEDYAYKVSMVIVKLADMFLRIKKEMETEVDTMMGLAIHILMSVARWEKKEFFQEKTITPGNEKERMLLENIELFLNEVSQIFGYRIGKGEAAAIMRYFQ